MTNPNGKKGSKQHQDVQDCEHKKMETEFEPQPEITVETEVPVPTPTSQVKNQVADVAAYSWLPKIFRMKFHKIVQVGKTNKDGTPVVREQQAIYDIEKHTGIKVTFMDYENYKLEVDDRKTN